MHPIVTRRWRTPGRQQAAGMRAVQEHVAPDPGSSFRCLPRRVPRYGLNLHHHGLVEMHAITRGAGTAVIGDRILPWRAPAAFLVGPGLVHTWASDPRLVPPPHASLVLQWPPGLLTRLEGLPEAAHLLAIQERAGRGLLLAGAAAQALAPLLEDFARQDGSRRLARWIEALACFARARPLASPRAPMTAGTGSRLARICQWLSTHACERVTLAGAARVAGMHPQALARFFRRHTGLSLIGYVQRLRIGRACASLVDDQRQSIAACALSSGFRGLAHFNRVFRQVHGCTPRQWRTAATGR